MVTKPVSRFVLQQGIVAPGLAIFSGILFAFSLPPKDCECLGWIAFVPLLVAALWHPALVPRRALYHFLLGLLTGVTTGVVQVGGQIHGSSLQFAYLPFLWIALVLGTITAISGAVFPPGKERATSFPGPLFVAALAVIVEWLTSFSPLPVGIALCQYRATALIQVASLTGIWGVSFLLWLVNAACAEALVQRRFTRSLGAAVLLAAVVWAGGALFLKNSKSESLPVRVAALQDYNGIEAPAVDASAPVRTSDLPDTEALLRDASSQGNTLIVTSEETMGSAFTPHRREDPLAMLAKETQTTLVVGFEEHAEPLPFNSAALIGPDGQTLGIHHKLFPFLGERQSIQVGQGAHAFDTPLGRIGLLICFDSCYTGPSRQAAGEGAQVLAIPNFDPPVPHAVLHYLHSALLPFRAVENRVAIVRADANGCSQIIDPEGRLAAQAPLYRSEILSAPVALGTGQGTFFTRWGDWFAIACAAGTVLRIIFPFSRIGRRFFRL